MSLGAVPRNDLRAGAQPEGNPGAPGASDEGELAFADPGSGCPAGQLLLCGRYDPMEATADGFRSLDVVEHLVTSADC